MVYRNTLEAVIENAKEITNLVSGFVNYNTIPVIEMDLTLEKVRNLYDILLILKQVQSKECDIQSEQDSKTITKPIDTEKPDTEDIPLEIRTSGDKKDRPSSIKHKESSDSDLLREKSAKTDSTPKIMSDRFKSQSTSIHDSLSKSQRYDNLSTKLKSKSISNIADAIGLNDKFIFIKELFNGDTNKYNETIEILNNATSFNDAYNYLMGSFNWDMDSQLVQILLDLIRRKLIINKDE